jgi:hypothetical protein
MLYRDKKVGFRCLCACVFVRRFWQLDLLNQYGTCGFPRQHGSSSRNILQEHHHNEFCHHFTRYGFHNMLFLFGYSWMMLFHPHKSHTKVPENTSPFDSWVWKTIIPDKQFCETMMPFKWVYAFCFVYRRAATTFSTVAITYMTEQ